MTPLNSQVPERAPMVKRIKIEGTAVPMVSVILSDIFSQVTPLLWDTHIATKAARMSAS